MALKNVSITAESGYHLAGQLFVPKTVSETAPAPAIVIAHGWQNLGEKQDLNYIELSRRGYVVFAIDMYGHGNSSLVEMESWWDEDKAGNGVYDAVRYLAAQPFVDADQIGVTGTSNGAFACNVAVVLDNKAVRPLISSVFLVCNEPVYTDKEDLYYSQYFDGADTGYVNVYGSRDVGVFADLYDEIFYRIKYPDGTLTTPLEYMEQPTAQSFLHFGVDPSGLEPRQADTYYTETINGEEASRIIYRPTLIHVLCNYSAKTVNAAAAFFGRVMPTEGAAKVTGQIWKWKALFNALGLAGAFVFFTCFILVMLDVPFFAKLKSSDVPALREIDAKQKKEVIRGMIGTAVISAVSYPILAVIAVIFQPAFFNIQRGWVVGTWAVFNALINLSFIRRNFARKEKKRARYQQLDAKAEGVRKSWDLILRDLLLAVIAVAALYLLVFVTTGIFSTDFRVWDLVTIRTFTADKLVFMLKYLPLLMPYYITLSVTTNVTNRVNIGKTELGNTVLLAVFNTLTPIILIALNLTCLFSTGHTIGDYIDWGVGSIFFYILSLFVLLPVSTVISRVIYRKTKDPYLGGFALGLLITLITVTTSMAAL